MTETLLTSSTVPPAKPIIKAPCPFDGGPAAVSHTRRGESIPEDGVVVDAYVWCHECGARGPRVEAFICDRAELWGLMTRAVELWNQRDERNIHLQTAELNLFPRPDGYDSPV